MFKVIYLVTAYGSARYLCGDCAIEYLRTVPPTVETVVRVAEGRLDADTNGYFAQWDLGDVIRLVSTQYGPAKSEMKHKRPQCSSCQGEG